VRALVTGASGFLGAVSSRRLEDDGWDVVRVGRPETEIPSPEFDAVLATAGAEVVVHCAGPASVPASIADPEADRAGSVGVLEALLERLAGLPAPPRVVLLSSAAVYGQPERLPADESAPLAAISPYGRNRVACESLLRGYHEQTAAPATTLRVFSAYGEGLRRQVLWDVSQKALSGGDVVLAGTGRESRDFVHAEDVAEAVSLVAGGVSDGHGAYNVATGRETSIGELAQLLVEALGVKTAVVFSGEGRAGDPERWQADIGRLQSLGFEVTVPLETGVRRYAEWVRATA
jgi:UDP-glucose 4-epimerase